MSVRTTILDLAMAIYEEAVTLVGEGPEADALASMALADLLDASRLDSERPGRAATAPASTTHRHARHERFLRASA
jgi:hypothetical protein